MSLILRMENAACEGPFAFYGLHSHECPTFQDEFLASVPWAHYDCNMFSCGIQTAPEWPHHIRDIPNSPDNDPIAEFFDIQSVRPEWRVGVQSPELFEHWFPKSSFPFFERWGFEVAEYEAEQVYYGTYQVIFPSTSSRLLRKVKPTLYEATPRIA